MARSGGMIAISLSMSMISFESLSVLEQYFWLMPLSLLPVSLSLSFAAVDFTPASKRAKYSSGIDEDRSGPDVLNWIRWTAVVGSFVLGFGVLFGHKALGLPIVEATPLFCYIMIIGQLIAILIDMLRGVKLLRFAQAQLGEDAVTVS